MKEIKIVYFRESLVQSILSDIVTFGTMLFCFWVNKTFLDSNTILGVLLFFFLLMWVLQRGIKNGKEFTSWEDIEKHIKEQKKSKKDSHE